MKPSQKNCSKYDVISSHSAQGRREKGACPHHFEEPCRDFGKFGVPDGVDGCRAWRICQHFEIPNKIHAPKLADKLAAAVFLLRPRGQNDVNV